VKQSSVIQNTWGLSMYLTLVMEISFLTWSSRKWMYSGKLYLEKLCSSSSPLLSCRSVVLGDYTSKASVSCLLHYKFLILSSAAGQSHSENTNPNWLSAWCGVG